MNDPYYNFCLEEIRFYTEKINEIINKGLKDPKKYYEDSKSEWKKIYQMIPFICFYIGNMVCIRWICSQTGIIKS